MANCCGQTIAKCVCLLGVCVLHMCVYVYQQYVCVCVYMVYVCVLLLHDFNFLE